MKRFKSILCASLLALAVSSSAFGGDITGRKGDITSKPGDITGKPGDITGAPADAYTTIRDILGIIIVAIVKP